MTAGPVTQELPFSARHYLDRLKALDAAPRGQKGYHRPQVDKLVQDLIKEVGRCQRATTLALTDRDTAREALKYRADAEAAERHPWEGPPTLAVDALVQGQQLAERSDRAANLEVAHRLAAADRKEREADELLAKAKASAFDPPTLTLPDAPNPTGDTAADLEAKAQHQADCAAAMKAWEGEVAAWFDRIEQQRTELEERKRAQQREAHERQQALLEQRSELLSELDRIEGALPAVRERVVDLTDRSGEEATQAMDAIEVAS